MTALIDALVDWIDAATAALIYIQEVPQNNKIALVEKLATIKSMVKEWKKLYE